MKIKCKNCALEIPEGEDCVFAVYKRTIDGVEYTFCCAECAEKYDEMIKNS